MYIQPHIVVSISFQNNFSSSLSPVKEVRVISPNTLFRIFSQSLVNKDQQLFTEYPKCPFKICFSYSLSFSKRLIFRPYSFNIGMYL